MTSTGKKVSGAKKTWLLTTPTKKTPPVVLRNLYTLEVFLLGGPVPDKFRGTTISRTIEMLGSHTLQDLHDIIFEAFHREEEHLWEFQIGGKGFDDKKNKHYGPTDFDVGDLPQVIDASDTTLDGLKLKKNQAFGYIFDFGDCWEHQINVMKIESTDKKKLEPRIVKKVGKAPPQYSDAE